MARKGFGRVKRKSPEVPKTQELVFQETIVLYSEVEKSEVLVEDHGKKDGGFFNIMNWGRDKGQDEPVEISSDESIEELEVIIEDEFIEIETDTTREKNMETRVTTIAETVEITGDVKMDGNLELYGRI